MATSTYSRKSIAVTITLDVGSQNNQYVFEGMAIDCRIDKQGGLEFAKAQVEIHGLSLDTMAQLTWINFKPNSRRWNVIAVDAGELGGAMSSIFKGEITFCYADLNGAKPVLRIQAQTGSYPQLISQSPTAVSGQQSVDSFVASQAEIAGYTFTNAGVDAQLSDSVINGDPITKMRTAADAVGADLIIDDNEVVLLPKGATRPTGSSAPLVSVETGMIGYPTFTTTGIQANSFFKPDLKIASLVKVESIVPGATGIWKVTQLTHDLSANNPGRQVWATSFQAIWIED